MLCVSLTVTRETHGNLNVYRLGYDVCIHTVAKWFTPTLSTAKTIASTVLLHSVNSETAAGAFRRTIPTGQLSDGYRKYLLFTPCIEGEN